MSRDRELPSDTAEVTRQFENEDGSANSVTPPVLPQGITAMTITQYRVGQYTYTSLDHALAEYQRQHKP